MKKLRLLLLFVMVLSLANRAVVQAQSPVEIHIAWYNDGNEGDVLRALLDKFEAANPDIKVVMDTVPYTSIQTQLPLQVQAGTGPDIGRVANYPGLVGNYLDLRPLLKDPSYWDKNFPASILQAMRMGDDKTGLYGYPNQFTVTGPFINRTLFDQAKIAVPSDTSPNVTWEQWTQVAEQVAKATNTKYAIAIDRSGHRFAGPAMSEGATFFDQSGHPTLDTPGLRTFANIIIGWNKNNLWPADVWLASGGSYSAASDYFINGQLVFYMSGSWQIQSFANKIGDAFDWQAVPNPSGPGGSTGMPGGTAVVAFKETKHPQETARVMEYIASHDVAAQFVAQTLFIPGHLDLASEGVKYQTNSKAAQDALGVFLKEVPKLSPQSYVLNNYRYNTALFNAIRDRLTQVLSGELTLDDAIKRMQQDIDQAIANGGAAAPTAAPTAAATASK